MDDRQEDKLGMYRTVGTVLDDNAAIFAGVPAMVTQHQNLNDSIGLIDSLAQAQSAVTTGITVDKKTFSDQMVSYGLRVAGALMAYASANNNNTLLAKADLKKDNFAKLRDDQRDDLAQDMHDEANAIVAQLADYNVTAATLSALQTRIDAFRLAIPSPETARKAKSTHTELLKQEFARADMILKQRLDGLIRGFEETNPQFVMDYRNARKITDTGSKGSGGNQPPAPPGP
jgi:hypothetical protein